MYSWFARETGVEARGLAEEGKRCGLARWQMGEIEGKELDVTVKTLGRVGVALKL